MSGPLLAVEPDERKRLGQYFTGEPLARVLAALADASSAASVIDPMAGSGDMLVAVSSMSAATTRLTGVELDPAASALCIDRLQGLPTAEVRTADAFQPSTWLKLRDASWDLVITNPPYVRYQRASRTSAGRVSIPSASEVRRGLIETLESRAALPKEEGQVFRTLAEGYSGLADLAVPSWILCASLVAQGGRLAMVVPDTWLSRDYALPVLYLLRRCFEIEFVVEDGEASWFEDALVRTTLVVARRVGARPTALAAEARRHVHARLTSDAADAGSVVGALYPEAAQREPAFAECLRNVAENDRPIDVPGLRAALTDDVTFGDRLSAQAGATSWGRALEPSLASGDQPNRPKFDVPRRLREVVEVGADRLCTLDELGWHVGQGLRTGANRFFYGEVRETDDTWSVVQFDRELAAEPLPVPSDLLRVAVRRQSDLPAPDGVPAASRGRLLVLDRYALEEDIAAAEAADVEVPYEPIPDPVAEFVRRAARLDVGSADAPRRIPELSAVVTNIRSVSTARPGRPPRFWYQLPPIAPRHTGEVFLPRINHGHPTPTMNSTGVVIDANFSTFWSSDDGYPMPARALTSLFSSSWAIAALESVGTVLGGGALKIEATQLRRLPLPRASAEHVVELTRLGGLMEQKRADTSFFAEVDDLVRAVLGLRKSNAARVDALGDVLLLGRTRSCRQI